MMGCTMLRALVSFINVSYIYTKQKSPKIAILFARPQFFLYLCSPIICVGEKYI